MRKQLITGTLLSVLAICACPVLADEIQMIPPTPLGQTMICPSGLQQMLVYSGASSSSGQSGINCVPISTDANGNLAATLDLYSHVTDTMQGEAAEKLNEAFRSVMRGKAANTPNLG